MSVEAITWAMRQRVGQSSAKMVLIALANCADPRSYECFPSVGYLCEVTEQNRKTVIDNIKRLCDAKFIEDTGIRKGRTGAVKQYRLKVDAVPKTEPLHAPDNRHKAIPKTVLLSGPESGIVEALTVPFSDGSSTENGHEAVPKTGYGNVNETKGKGTQGTTEVRSDAADPCPIADIVALYHAQLPNNPKVKLLTEQRKGLIRARWKEAASLTCKPFGYKDRAAGLRAWDAFFAICSGSAFLTGKSTPQPGRPPFFASIDFLMSPSGFAKTLENHYHREVAA